MDFSLVEGSQRFSPLLDRLVGLTHCRTNLGIELLSRR